MQKYEFFYNNERIFYLIAALLCFVLQNTSTTLTTQPFIYLFGLSEGSWTPSWVNTQRKRLQLEQQK